MPEKPRFYDAKIAKIVSLTDTVKHFVLMTDRAHMPKQTSIPKLQCYEELVEAPAKTLQTLASATGLKLSLDRIDNPVWLEAEARHEEAWISPLEEQKPSTESVGAYRDVMRPREIALIEQICAPVMSFGGYEPSSSPATGALTGPMKLARDVMNRIRRGYWSYRARFP